MNTNSIRIISLLVIICLLLTACGSSKQAVSAPQEQFVISYGVDADTLKTIRSTYHGAWYGFLKVDNVTGYNIPNGIMLDVCAYINFDVLSPDAPVASVSIWQAGDPSFEVANFSIQCGENDSMSINGARILGTDPSAMKHWFEQSIPDMLRFGGETKNDNGSFVFDFYLRRWGTLWDDVLEDMPGSAETKARYEGWYLPLVQTGQEMPR